jgi:DNA-binding HxlR family transcriptional regulator
MGVSKKEISPCPIDVTLSVIDGRWKGTILWQLLDGPMRTNELRKSIPEVTERMLLRHLRDMTGVGILERHQEQGLPLRVRYSLTPYGRTLVPVLKVLCSWGREHLKRDPSGVNVVNVPSFPGQVATTLPGVLLIALMAPVYLLFRKDPTRR